MARLPYPDRHDPGIAELLQRIIAERGNLHPPYDMLLHSPPLAAGWLHQLTSVRHESTLPGYLRELVIMRIAILTRAEYEAQHHAPLALREGVTQAQLDALANWRHSDRFSQIERAALAYTDAMTLRIQVPDSVFAAIRAALDDRRLVELTVTIAAYNMVSRVLEALQLGSFESAT